MERTVVYRAWQAPFSERKFAPVLEHNDLGQVRRVLDVGCGPGTNTHHFSRAGYLGIDINPAYVESARRRHQREFAVRDVRAYEVDPAERFDFVLVNSFLHHIDTAHVDSILAQASRLLTRTATCTCSSSCCPRGARWRAGSLSWTAATTHGPLAEWERLFVNHFEPVVFEPYPLGLVGSRSGAWCTSRVVCAAEASGHPGLRTLVMSQVAHPDVRVLGALAVRETAAQAQRVALDAVEAGRRGQQGECERAGHVLDRATESNTPHSTSLMLTTTCHR